MKEFLSDARNGNVNWLIVIAVISFVLGITLITVGTLLNAAGVP